MIHRREFLAGSAAGITARLPVVDRPKPAQWFRLGETAGHQWFIAPDGSPFFSLGLNHFDSATLRQPEGLPAWQQKYGNSQERWIKEAVGPDLQRWGFNTNGYTHEIVLKSEDRFRRSRLWSFEEFQWLGMPYCHTLNFLNFNWTEVEMRYLDVFSKDFEDWCDYLARDIVARHAGDPNLIGWFFTDCPTWTFSQRPKLKPPLFDPERLKTPEGRREFSKLAARYYEVTTAAVRRYDPHHLILGDRFEGRSHLPDDLLRIAARAVDVLCFQYFPRSVEDMVKDLDRWHQLTKKPLLIADAAPPARDARNYSAMIQAVRALPYLVGFHYCGAYLKNRVRGHGFRDEKDREIQEVTGPVSVANLETLAWQKRITGTAK